MIKTTTRQTMNNNSHHHSTKNHHHEGMGSIKSSWTEVNALAMFKVFKTN
jgi:hypothetical protein